MGSEKKGGGGGESVCVCVCVVVLLLLGRSLGRTSDNRGYCFKLRLK
jgi:hypothetical protein